MAAGVLEQFDAAIRKVTTDRGAIYGHPADDFAIATALKSAVAECPDPLLRHVLEMIAVKMARAVHSPSHLDTWIDIAGYARTAVMVMDRREKEADTALNTARWWLNRIAALPNGGPVPVPVPEFDPNAKPPVDGCPCTVCALARDAGKRKPGPVSEGDGFREAMYGTSMQKDPLER